MVWPDYFLAKALRCDCPVIMAGGRRIAVKTDKRNIARVDGAVRPLARHVNAQTGFQAALLALRLFILKQKHPRPARHRYSSPQRLLA